MTHGVIVSLLIAAPVVGVLGGCWHLRHRPNWSPFVPWIVGTTLGIALFTACYWWFFETEGCGGRGDFVCLVNKNQGFTTLVALLLTVAGLWIAKITHEAELRSVRNENRADSRSALEAALGEVVHNLLHVALDCGADGRVSHAPQLSTVQVAHLLDPKHRGFIRRGVRERADLILRNFDRIKSDRIHAGWAYEALVTQSLGFLVAAGRYHSSWALEPLSAPGLQDLLSIAKGDKSHWTYYRSSDIPEKELAAVRSEDGALLVWIEDKVHARTRVFAQHQRFVDMANAHGH